MKLTKNFSLSEFEHSNTAKSKGIDNRLPEYLLNNVTCLAERLQSIRNKLDAPITISSGYRCPALNKAVDGVKTSQHQLGLAADIHTPDMPAKQLFDFILASNIGFDQLIVEHAGGKEWVHISVCPNERNEVLSYDGANYEKINN